MPTEDTLADLPTSSAPHPSNRRGTVRPYDLMTFRKRPGRTTYQPIMIYEPPASVLPRWKLYNAWPMKWKVPDFDGKGTDVEMEGIVEGMLQI